MAASLRRLRALPGLAVFLAAAPAFGATARPNVVLITIDTLRADHLPAYGYQKVKTPAIDSLVKDGVLFKRAVAHAPITLPSHTSIMTGLYPMTHGVRNNGDYYLPDSIPTLAEVLQRSGYRTAAFVSAFLLDARFGLNRGFDVYDDSTTSQSSQARPELSLTRRRRGDETAAKALAWLDSRGSDQTPFFLWVHFFDPHQDYDLPEPYLTQYKDHPYDGEIAFTDAQVRALLDRLKGLGLYRDTLVVLTGDHGEGLGEHGESAHSIFIYDSTQRIPLILKLPQERRAGITVAPLARHVDIVPTVLDVLNIPATAFHDLPGRSLMGSAPDSAVRSYAEAYLPKDYYGWSSLESVDDGAYKYIQAPKPELYDLGRDPHEKENLQTQQSDRAMRMQAQLEALQKKYSAPEAAGRAAHAPDAALLSALRDSGYMGGLPQSAAESGKDPKDMIGLQETMLSAHHLIAEENYDEAMRVLRRVLKDNPENVSVRATLAETLRKTGHPDESVREYGEIIKLNPDSVSAHLALAHIYIKDWPDYKAAEVEIARAEALAPKEPSIWVMRGDLAQVRGDIAGSMELYKKAQAMGERSSDLMVGQGSAFNREGRFAQARDELLDAVKTEPDNAEAHYNLGVVLEHLGAPPQAAEKEYRLALRYNPRDNLSYGNLGSLYRRLGRDSEAEDALLAALKIKPTDLIALYNLGCVYMDTGRTQAAVPLFEKIVAVDPTSVFGPSGLAPAYSKLGKEDEAFLQYQKITRMEQATAAARGRSWYAMARIRAGRSRKKEAREYLQEALKLGGDNLRRQVQSDPLFAGWDVPTKDRP
jgi:arylsulfatase A-like enzyme/Tfp pilus assembly protein PilF